MKYDKKLIEDLWHKYRYEDKQGVKSDRAAMIAEYEQITGSVIPLGTIKKYISQIINNYEEKGSIDGEYIKYSENEHGDITSTIRKYMAAKRTFTNRELLELHAINPDENEIKQIVSNEWSMTTKDGDTYYNFQSKIIAVPISAGGISWEEFAEIVHEPPVAMKIEYEGIGERNLLIGLSDLHFPVSTLESLEREISEVMEIVMNGYDTIVIEQAGDLFESSQINESITLRGTILPTADMAKAWSDAKSLYWTLIDHCLEHCNKVQIEHACGNHSGNLEYVFLDGIKDRYSLLGKDKVVVNNHKNYRTAYKIGNVGIMLSHGDTVKLKDLPGKFASEYPLLWGSCESHECHAGHKHNKFTETDINGVVLRQHPTPKPPSDWEDKFGYLSRKMIQLIEYNEDRSKVIYEI